MNFCSIFLSDFHTQQNSLRPLFLQRRWHWESDVWSPVSLKINEEGFNLPYFLHSSQRVEWELLLEPSTLFAKHEDTKSFIFRNATSHVIVNFPQLKWIAEFATPTISTTLTTSTVRRRRRRRRIEKDGCRGCDGRWEDGKRWWCFDSAWKLVWCILDGGLAGALRESIRR